MSGGLVVTYTHRILALNCSNVNQIHLLLCDTELYIIFSIVLHKPSGFRAYIQHINVHFAICLLDVCVYNLHTTYVHYTHLIITRSRLEETMIVHTDTARLMLILLFLNFHSCVVLPTILKFYRKSGGLVYIVIFECTKSRLIYKYIICDNINWNDCIIVLSISNAVVGRGLRV